MKKKSKNKTKNKPNTPWESSYGNAKLEIELPEGSLYDEIERITKEYPNYIAYNYFNHKVTFNKFIKDIKACARSLRSYGIEKGDAVTICMPNTPEAIVSFYAINMIGAIANMIHPLSAENEIKDYLNMANSTMLITVDLAWSRVENILVDTKVQNTVVVSVKESMPMLLGLGYQLTKGFKIKKPKISDSVMFWKDFIAHGGNYVDELKSVGTKDDYAAILYSGGTTGISKGIVLSNYNINSAAFQSLEACQALSPGDASLAILPIFHCFGLGICIHAIMSKGATAVLIPQFVAKDFHKLLKAHHPNVIIGVPTLYEALINNKSIEDLSYLKLAISGGDTLTPSLKYKIDDFFEEHGASIEVREGYGLTESSGASCLMPLNKYKEGSIGVPVPNMYYKIVAPNTEDEMPYGEEGEIVISGPSVMVGYLNEEVETNQALRIHSDDRIWLHTGDVGTMDEEGYIYFTQRIKRMIVSSGYNVYPGQVENVINSYPDVLTSTVVGIPHPYKHQVAKAFIVLKQGVEPSKVLERNIRDHCAKSLAKFSLPYEYEFRESLPKTLIGKVAYTKLIEEEVNKNKGKE